MKIGRPASQGPSASTSKGLRALAISKVFLPGMDMLSLENKNYLKTPKKVIECSIS